MFVSSEISHGNPALMHHEKCRNNQTEILFEMN
jgi:hypothetical protein